MHAFEGCALARMHQKSEGLGGGERNDAAFHTRVKSGTRRGDRELQGRSLRGEQKRRAMGMSVNG